ncbi:MAG: chromosomal replication initiator protein DnaA [Rikenellaceae bacterium]
MLQNLEKYSTVWQSCLDLFREHTTEEEYVRWFAPIMPLAYDGQSLRLEVPDKSYVQHIESNYLDFVRPIIAQQFGNKTRLFYAVPRAEQSGVAIKSNSISTSNSFNQQPNSAAQIKNPFAVQSTKGLNIDPNLSERYTFKTFVEGECNKLAVSAGHAIAQSPGNNPFNPLYIYGNSGLGKTHLVQAIGHEIRKNSPQQQVLYVSMNKFQAQFTTAIKSGEINNFVHFYQNIDILIIDDIQDLSGKEKTQNTFFHIFSHLLLSGKQIILTSDKPPVELKDIEQRLITRFKWGFATQINTPDFATKRRIIDVKARRMGAFIPDDVIDFLAHNITANVREIEGALSSLMAHASLLNSEVTVALAKDILKVYVKVINREVTINRILEIASDYFEISVEKICSATRTRNVALARQSVMYLAKEYTKLPLSAIGSAVGGRKHATVLHSYKTVVNMLETDKRFRKQIEDIEKRILI